MGKLRTKSFISMITGKHSSNSNFLKKTELVLQVQIFFLSYAFPQIWTSKFSFGTPGPNVQKFLHP
jgi:hypothetical protein